MPIIGYLYICEQLAEIEGFEDTYGENLLFINKMVIIIPLFGIPILNILAILYFIYWNFNLYYNYIIPIIMPDINEIWTIVFSIFTVALFWKVIGGNFE